MSKREKIKGKLGPKMKKAFSLVELIIVVAVLGILAAMVVPQFQGHVTEAKEAAVKDNLRILRAAIAFYAAQHRGSPPGYFNGQPTPSFTLYLQLTSYTDMEGNATGTKSQDHPYGPYLRRFPQNCFNNKTTVRMLADGEFFPASADGSYGWLYKPATKTIRLDWPGTDKDGIRYYDY